MVGLHLSFWYSFKKLKYLQITSVEEKDSFALYSACLFICSLAFYFNLKHNLIFF